MENKVFFTFSLNRSMDKASALIDVVDFLVKLQSWFVLCVVDVDDGTCISTQQRIHRHAQFHVETLGSLKHLVIINDYGAHLDVLPLVKLHLQIKRKNVVLNLPCENKKHQDLLSQHDG